MSDLLTLARNLRPYIEEAAQSLSDADGLKAAALYVRVDEAHVGTLADPIPYEGNMALTAGLYYTQDGVTYLCTRDTGIAVYNALSELVGLYVEEMQG